MNNRNRQIRSIWARKDFKKLFFNIQYRNMDTINKDKISWRNWAP